MLLIATLSVAMLPCGFSYFSNTSQSWIDIHVFALHGLRLFGKGEALLLGVVFAADVLGRCFVQTKDRPSRLIIGLMAGLLCLGELPFYGKASTATAGAAEPIAFWSLICLAVAFFLEIAVILEEEL